MRNMFCAGLLAGIASLATVPAQPQQQCRQQAYGTACGPTLTVTFTPNGAVHFMEIRMDNGFALSHGIWIWGIQELAWPIPGSQCLLYTDFVYGHPFMTNASGSAFQPHSWPMEATGAFVRLQAASVQIDGNNNLVVRTTNGVFATCVRP